MVGDSSSVIVSDYFGVIVSEAKQSFKKEAHMDLKGSIKVKDLNFYYGTHQALKNISMTIEPHQIVAMIGPSGCGKSTLIRIFNRMNDLIPQTRVEGEVLIDGTDIYDKNTDVVSLRRRVGMVFQKSTPFPKSIYENIAYGLKIVGIKDRRILNEAVEKSLKRAALWEEVKDNLNKSAMSLSGGQQQRLCIARAIAIDPQIILMDEPCSALDPIATARIEELMGTLKDEYTIVVVTHNMQQAGRVSDKTAFLMHGQIIEFNKTTDFFTRPSSKVTEDYITGRFG
ncbi:MAG: phosphate ABC transporter ATP-binding protein [Candidatus Omnitrophica bacterium]|nr:phosphate ABC transporter ATP-binding protein [Candidatus Omnitrophota bacterium]